MGFRLLTEYYSFLFDTIEYIANDYKKFPSPYGVLFILIDDIAKFCKEKNTLVSVSLRSIIHSYGVTKSMIGSNSRVSVSLRSIIHSYVVTRIYLRQLLNFCFRLLAEYHSFLFKKSTCLSKLYHCFRLLAEYHSFLL